MQRKSEINLKKHYKKFKKVKPEELYLSRAALGGKKIDAEYIQEFVIPFLNRKPKIKTLNLSGHMLGDEVVSALAGTTLEKLYLKNNLISPIGATALSKCNLLVLDLSNNKIGDIGAAAFATNTTLKKLYLKNNRISPVGATALSKCNLSVLDLSNNNIGESVGFLACNPNIKILIVKNCNILGKHVKLFAFNISLRELNISYNHLGNEGVIYLSANTHIEKLNLGFNRIGDEGAAYLSTCGDNLLELDLSSNEIGDVGATHLAGNRWLIELNLTDNAIGNEGVKSFATTTRTNLEALYLIRNKKIQQNIARELLSNHDLAIYFRSVDLGDRDDDNAERLAHALTTLDPITRVNCDRYVGIKAEVPSLLELSLFKVKNLLQNNPNYDTSKLPADLLERLPKRKFE